MVNERRLVQPPGLADPVPEPPESRASRAEGPALALLAVEVLRVEVLGATCLSFHGQIMVKNFMVKK
jgi:hypothetical protein